MLLPMFSRVGFDPGAEMRRMQNEMNRMLAGLERDTRGEFPPINLWMGENSVVVTAELPGFAEADVDVTVHADTLTLRGKREFKADGEVAWHRRERDYGAFSRVLRLPFRVDPDKVRARFQDGLLEIELERPEAEKPRRIRISSAAS